MYMEYGFSKAGMAPPTRPHILIIVQNLPVPLDRRVWLECQALVGRWIRGERDLPERPGGPEQRQLIDGVHIYKYKSGAGGGGAVRFRAGVRYSLAAHGVAVAGRMASPPVRRHPGVQSAGHLLVARALLARPWQCGSCLTIMTSIQSCFVSRFGEPEWPIPLGWSYVHSLWLERMTFRTAASCDFDQ